LVQVRDAAVYGFVSNSGVSIPEGMTLEQGLRVLAGYSERELA